MALFLFSKLFRFVTKGLTFLAVLAAIVTILQGQDPLLENTIDHDKKMITITNRNIVPVISDVFVIKYNLKYDSEGELDSKNSFFNTIGFINKNGIGKREDIFLWSMVGRKLFNLNDLNSDLIKFHSEDHKNNILNSNIYYCFLITSRNLLSNKEYIYTLFTSDVKSPLSAMEENPEGVELGGNYGGEKIRDSLKKELVEFSQNVYKYYDPIFPTAYN